jgi:phage terminase large subunit
MSKITATIGESFLPLFNPVYKHYGFFGGRACGKTHAVAAAVVILMARKNERVVCSRQYMSSIRDSSHEILCSKIYSLGLNDSFKILDNEIEHLNTGSRATFIGLQVNPQSIKATEGVSLSWCDESQTVSREALEVLVPTFLRKPGSRLIFTWNPDSEEDPVDQYYRGDNPPPNAYVRHITQADNPFFHQTESPALMEHMRRAEPKRFEHIWLGGYNENSDVRIYQNIRTMRMFIPPHATCHFGMDFGFNDPNALVKVYYWIPRDRNGVKLFGKLPVVYIAQEAVGNVPLTELDGLMDTVPDARDNVIVGDSSRPETIDYLSRQGFTMTSSRKGAGSIKNGINFLQGCDIVIDPECTYAGREFKKYSWKQDRAGRILTTPEDADNHTCDAVRYALEDVIDNDEGAAPLRSRGFTRIKF